MATSEKKRYWLKLDKDFLKSSQIKVIKNMPNGKDYIIFYLALLLESVETIGHLRFSELVPYNEEMLASVTDTNIDIVRSAVKLFKQLGLMELLDDGTLYMTQVAEMTGKESDSAERVRLYRIREKQKEEERLALQCNGNVTNSNDNKEKDKQSTENNIQDIDNKEETNKEEDVCVSEPEKNNCHLKREFKIEQCMTCLRRYLCTNPTSPEFKILHSNMTLDEYVEKREKRFEEFLKEAPQKNIPTDNINIYNFVEYDWVEEYDWLNEDEPNITL